MSTSVKTPIQRRSRTIDGLKIRFAHSDDRGEHALPVAFMLRDGARFSILDTVGADGAES